MRSGSGTPQSREDVQRREGAGTFYYRPSRCQFRSRTVRALSGSCLRHFRQPSETKATSLRTSQISRLAVDFRKSRQLESAQISSAWRSSSVGWCTQRTIRRQGARFSPAEVERKSISVGRRRTFEVY